MYVLYLRCCGDGTISRQMFAAAMTAFGGSSRRRRRRQRRGWSTGDHIAVIGSVAETVLMGLIVCT